MTCPHYMTVEQVANNSGLSIEDVSLLRKDKVISINQSHAKRVIHLARVGSRSLILAIVKENFCASRSK